MGCYRLVRNAFTELRRARPQMADDFSPVLAERQQGLAAARRALDAQAHARGSNTDRHEILRVIQRFLVLSEGA